MATMPRVRGAVLFLAIAAAAAQQPDSERSEMALEEVTVTARKIEESLQRVPIAVTALDEATLSRPNVVQLKNLTAIAPNVTIGTVNSFPTAAAVSIRGIGTTDIDSSFEPAVGIVVDGLFLGRISSSALDLFDVERIEVLRGPQGTLFGRNTIGGVVNLVNARPTQEFEGKARLTIGNFQRVDFRGVLNLPFGATDNALRLSLLSNRSDGPFRNNFNGKRLGGTDVQAARAKLLLAPAENVEILLSGEATRDRGDVLPGIPASYPNQNAARIGFPAVFTGDPYRDRVNQNGDNIADFDTATGVVEVNWRTASGTLTSVTGYRTVDEDYYTDFDATPVRLFETRRLQAHRQFSQELRFATATENRWDLVGGIYYYDQQYRLNQTTFLDIALALAMGTPGATTSVRTGRSIQDAKSWAIFGEGTYRFTDSLRGTLGLRYTGDEKEFDHIPVAVAQNRVVDDNTWSRTTWRAVFDYVYSDRLMYYASVSSGYKSGGYNGQAGSVTSIGPYANETVLAYEAGAKSELAGGRARFNLAAFYTDHKDLQVRTLRPIPGGTLQESVINNAAGVETWGLEAELLARLTATATLRASVGYLNARYTEFFTDYRNVGFNEDASFLDLRRAPEWTAALDYAQRFRVGDTGSIVAHLGINYTSDQATTVANDAFARTGDNTLVNLGARWVSPEEKFEIGVFANNAFDKAYLQAGLVVANLFSYYNIAPPRTYGAEFLVRF